MSIGPWQIILIVLVVVLLFGRGKISGLMGDFAQGIKAFKSGLKEEPSDKTDGDDAKVLKSESGEDAVDTDKDKTANS